MAGRLPLLLALITAPGCRSGGGDENLGLGAQRRDVSVDVRALDRPGELEKALALPSSEAASRLGPHRLAATTKLDLAAGESKDAFEETFRLEVDLAGASRLVHETNHDAGTEAVAAGGNYYVRARHGRFARRSPEGDEVDRARDAVQGLVRGYLDVLGRFAARSVAGESDLAGRRVVTVKLALAATPGPPAAESETGEAGRAWRRVMRVDALDGVVLVDAKTGVPLKARLDAKYRSLVDARGGRAVNVTLHHESAVEALGAIAAISAPTDSGPAPVRPRPLVDRQILLEGLAPTRNVLHE